MSTINSTATPETFLGGVPLPGAADARPPMLKLLGAWGRHKLIATVVVLAQVAKYGLAIAGNVTGAYIVGLAVTGSAAADLVPWIGLLALFVIGQAVGNWADMWLAHDLAYRILSDFRATVYQALERLAPAYLLDRRSGDVTRAVMGDVENLEWFYAHTAASLFSVTIVTVASFAVLALVFHPLLAVLMLPVLALVVTVPAWLGKKADRQGEHVIAELSKVNADTVDAVQGLREIVAFGQGAAWLRKLSALTTDLNRAVLKYDNRRGFERAAEALLIASAMVAVLVLGAWLVSSGQMTFALYPAAVAMAATMFAPVQDLTGIAQTFGQLKASARRVFEVLEAQPAVADRVAQSPRGPVEPAIHFEGVSLRYKPDLPDVLTNVTFDVRPGETVALVGHSGAGKSTCTHLLMRFWDVSSGRITIGGHDVRQWTQHDLRDLMTLVPQDIYLFNASLRDNLMLGRPDATEADVAAAADAALIHDFIITLPKGYDTNAGERGVQMSGGQRQRIAIARALLKNAPILVMDEAVSNLDTESEQALRRAVARLRDGRTLLIIAHRLSTIRSADRIVVLKDGEVAEVGTHDELSSLDGEYARLIASQRDGVVA